MSTTSFSMLMLPVLFVATACAQKPAGARGGSEPLLPRVEKSAKASVKATTKSTQPAAREFITLDPVKDRPWFTFQHPRYPGNRWKFRMPEHGYYDKTTERSSRPHSVQWKVQPDRRKATFWCVLPEAKKKEYGLDFRGKISAGKDTIDFELRLKNVGPEAWAKQQMGLFCLPSGEAPMFHDYEAERTHVRKGGKWITMNEVIKGKFPSHRMVGASVHSRSRGVERLAAKLSKDGKTVLGLATSNAGHLSFNFNRRTSCIHSNPRWGLLKPGQEVTARGKIYLFEGTLDELYQRYAKDFGVKKSE